MAFHSARSSATEFTDGSNALHVFDDTSRIAIIYRERSRTSCSEIRTNVKPRVPELPLPPPGGSPRPRAFKVEPSDLAASPVAARSTSAVTPADQAWKGAHFKKFQRVESKSFGRKVLRDDESKPTPAPGERMKGGPDQPFGIDDEGALLSASEHHHRICLEDIGTLSFQHSSYFRCLLR